MERREYNKARRRSSLFRIDEKVQQELRKIDAENATYWHLLRAIDAGDDIAVDTMLSLGKLDVNETQWDSWSPLMVAALSSNRSVTTKLLLAGADIHYKDDRGVTPCMVAASRGNAEALAVLIHVTAHTSAVLASASALFQGKADIEQRDEYGNSALNLSAAQVHA